MIYSLPFGEGTVPLDIDAARVHGVLLPPTATAEGVPSGADLVCRALESPIGSARLRELARGKARVTVITSDHTRPVPSRLTLPLLLAEIRAGAPAAGIRIVIATGCHRGTTDAEMRRKFGAELVEREHFLVHDASVDPGRFVSLGDLPSGCGCRVSAEILDTDLLVAEGFIEPHFFAGFSGGRKAVLPGCADRETVLGNHSAGLIAHPSARAGVLDGNPIHADMLYAAKRAGLAFILNVSLDTEKRVVGAFAGDPELAHLEGCAFVGARNTVRGRACDIVITTNGGYPLDQNLYQAVKCLTAAEAVCRPGGVIIAAAECRDGHGGEDFASAMDGYASPAALLAAIERRKWNESLPDQWQVQILCRVLSRNRVVMVTGTGAPPDMVERLGMRHARSLAEALATAEREIGDPRAGVTVIPDGVGAIVECAGG